MKQLFLNNTFILALILINAVVIILQESGLDNIYLQVLDTFITTMFMVEAIVKIKHFGFKNYLKDDWNVLDFFLVIIAIPSLFSFIIPQTSILSVLLSLRILRILKFFRLIKFFPNTDKLVKGLKIAIRDSSVVFITFLILILIFDLISCEMFGDVSPEYFGDPLASFYTTFRLCTVEGWYEIPDNVAQALGGGVKGSLVKFYFSALLFIGGIIGLSFVNSIFVDSMAYDNNDETNQKIDALSKQIEELNKKIDELNKK